MNTLQLIQIVRDTLQAGLGRAFWCRISLPWVDGNWNPTPHPHTLVYEVPDCRPCVRVRCVDGYLIMETIENDENHSIRYEVPLADPEAFDKIEARIKCEDYAKAG